jgi:hypothetical protein
MISEQTFSPMGHFLAWEYVKTITSRFNGWESKELGHRWRMQNLRKVQRKNLF